MLKLKLLKTLNTRTGQALILAYVVLIFLTILAAAFLTKAVTENNLSQRHKLIQEATYLAEGAIEDAIYKFSDAIANFDIAPDEASYIVVTNYGSFYNATVNSTVLRLEDDDRIVDVGGGAAALVRNYKITSSCQHPLNNTIVVTLHQIVARQIVPAFQHAVFYEDVLEILPGINMDFSGRIHSNHDIYLGAEGGRILTVHSDYLHSAGEIYNRRKNDGTRMAGDVSIKEKIDG
ncbi:MAG: hypothetical protein JW714_01195, partial [Candidatus Omnitrophica bacterium]|nr:hypothetical protein [Candidatus Omnitrophota bacterium]